MRLLVFFDLPVDTPQDRKRYRIFRKFLIKDGYLMMQESVYSKMVVDAASADASISRLRRNAPEAGLVQVLKVTEKQYAGIIEIAGSKPVSSAVDDAGENPDSMKIVFETFETPLELRQDKVNVLRISDKPLFSSLYCFSC